MFSKNLVLYVTQHKIYVFDNVFKEKDLELDWDSDSLVKALQAVKKKYQNRAVKAKVIVGEDLSYVCCVDISGGVDGKKVIAKASGFIPEELVSENYSWKVVDAKLGRVQLAVIPQSFLNNISFAAKQARVEIDSIAPISLLLATETEGYKQPQVIVYTGVETIAAVAFRGNVLFSTKVADNLSEKIQLLLELVLTKFSIKPSSIIFNIDKEVGFPSKWEKINRNLNPMVTVKKKKVKKSQDTHEEIVPVAEPVATAPALTETQPVEAPAASVETPSVGVVEPSGEVAQEEAEKVEEKEDSGKIVISKKVFLVGVFLVIIILAAGYAFLRSKGMLIFQPSGEPQAELTEAPEESPTSTPTPDVEVSLKDYKLQVLNGTGIVGVAQTVADELVENGFEETDIGNADDYTYEGIDIEAKEGLPDEVLEGITETLADDYDISVSGEYLAADSEYDVVVIVGKK